MSNEIWNLGLEKATRHPAPELFIVKFSCKITRLKHDCCKKLTVCSDTVPTPIDEMRLKQVFDKSVTCRAERVISKVLANIAILSLCSLLIRLLCVCFSYRSLHSTFLSDCESNLTFRILKAKCNFLNSGQTRSASDIYETWMLPKKLFQTFCFQPEPESWLLIQVIWSRRLVNFTPKLDHCSTLFFFIFEKIFYGRTHIA